MINAAPLAAPVVTLLWQQWLTGIKFLSHEYSAFQRPFQTGGLRPQPVPTMGFYFISGRKGS